MCLDIITKLISRERSPVTIFGGITQLVEKPVHTRYVICSSQIAATRPVGQAVKTPPFHGGNMGSIPVRVTKNENLLLPQEVFIFVDSYGIERAAPVRRLV